MFVTVMFGAGCRELVNAACSLVTLKAHLKRRGQVPPDATIALLAEDGHLVTLSPGPEVGTTQALTAGTSLLRARGTYVLVQVVRGEGGAPPRYESLLENLDRSHPELAEGPPPSEELRWLSGVPSMGEARRRRAGTRRGQQEPGPPSRSRRTGSLPPKAR